MASYNSSFNHLVTYLYRDKIQPRPHRYRQLYLSDMLNSSNFMYTQDIRGHYSCVNALAFSHFDQQYLASGGDGCRILIWKIESLLDCDNQYNFMMRKVHNSNIFSIGFSCDDSFIFSAGNDGQIVKYDFTTGEFIRIYSHPAAIYCVDPSPVSPHIFAAGTEDGSVFIVDSRLPSITQDMILDNCNGAYHSVSINPCEEQLVAVGSEIVGSALFDLRNWNKLFSYESSNSWPLYSSKHDTTSVSFNRNGTRLFSMQRSLPPCIYSTLSSSPIFVCVDETGMYKNSVTMKSGCFAGSNDEYVVSGSDDFRVYWWLLPDHSGGTASHEEIITKRVLPGHRSIVNQTRFSHVHNLLCSSGVEKIIKLWSPFPFQYDQSPQLSLAPPSREPFSLAEQMYNDFLSSDNNEESIEEDMSVLAFFDQLIQQEERSQNLTSDDDSDDDISAYSYHGLYERRLRRYELDIDSSDIDSNITMTPISSVSGNTSSYILSSCDLSLNDSDSCDSIQDDDDDTADNSNGIDISNSSSLNYQNSSKPAVENEPITRDLTFAPSRFYKQGSSLSQDGISQMSHSVIQHSQSMIDVFDDPNSTESQFLTDDQSCYTISNKQVEY